MHDSVWRFYGNGFLETLFLYLELEEKKTKTNFHAQIFLTSVPLAQHWSHQVRLYQQKNPHNLPANVNHCICTSVKIFFFLLNLHFIQRVYRKYYHYCAMTVCVAFYWDSRRNQTKAKQHKGYSTQGLKLKRN